jgi:hypothetical protein
MLRSACAIVLAVAASAAKTDGGIPAEVVPGLSSECHRCQEHADEGSGTAAPTKEGILQAICVDTVATRDSKGIETDSGVWSCLYSQAALKNATVKQCPVGVGICGPKATTPPVPDEKDLAKKAGSAKQSKQHECNYCEPKDTTGSHLKGVCLQSPEDFNVKGAEDDSGSWECLYTDVAFAKATKEQCAMGVITCATSPDGEIEAADAAAAAVVAALGDPAAEKKAAKAEMAVLNDKSAKSDPAVAVTAKQDKQYVCSYCDDVDHSKHALESVCMSSGQFKCIYEFSEAASGANSCTTGNAVSCKKKPLDSQVEDAEISASDAAAAAVVAAGTTEDGDTQIAAGDAATAIVDDAAMGKFDPAIASTLKSDKAYICNFCDTKKEKRALSSVCVQEKGKVGDEQGTGKFECMFQGDSEKCGAEPGSMGTLVKCTAGATETAATASLTATAAAATAVTASTTTGGANLLTDQDYLCSYCDAHDAMEVDLNGICMESKEKDEADGDEDATGTWKCYYSASQTDAATAAKCGIGVVQCAGKLLQTEGKGSGDISSSTMQSKVTGVHDAVYNPAKLRTDKSYTCSYCDEMDTQNQKLHSICLESEEKDDGTEEEGTGDFACFYSAIDTKRATAGHCKAGIVMCDKNQGDSVDSTLPMSSEGKKGESAEVKTAEKDAAAVSKMTGVIDKNEPAVIIKDEDYLCSYCDATDDKDTPLDSICMETKEKDEADGDEDGTGKWKCYYDPAHAVAATKGVCGVGVVKCANRKVQKIEGSGSGKLVSAAMNKSIERVAESTDGSGPAEIVVDADFKCGYCDPTDEEGSGLDAICLETSEVDDADGDEEGTGKFTCFFDRIDTHMATAKRCPKGVIFCGGKTQKIEGKGSGEMASTAASSFVKNLQQELADALAKPTILQDDEENRCGECDDASDEGEILKGVCIETPEVDVGSVETETGQYKCLYGGMFGMATKGQCQDGVILCKGVKLPPGSMEDAIRKAAATVEDEPDDMARPTTPEAYTELEEKAFCSYCAPTGPEKMPLLSVCLKSERSKYDTGTWECNYSPDLKLQASDCLAGEVTCNFAQPDWADITKEAMESETSICPASFMDQKIVESGYDGLSHTNIANAQQGCCMLDKVMGAIELLHHIRTCAGKVVWNQFLADHFKYLQSDGHETPDAEAHFKGESDATMAVGHVSSCYANAVHVFSKDL